LEELDSIECVWGVEEDVIDAADMQTLIRRSQDEDSERKPEREEKDSRGDKQETSSGRAEREHIPCRMTKRFRRHS
jgi:hypothetical protein